MGASGSDLPGFSGSLALSLVSLGLVCLAAYLFVRWLARRSGGHSDGPIHVIGRCFLEPRRSLYLVEVAERCFLVGVGDGPMTMLAEIERTALPAAPPTGQGPASAFAQILTKLMRREGR